MPVLLVLCASVDDIVGIVACFDVGVVDHIKNEERKKSFLHQL